MGSNLTSLDELRARVTDGFHRRLRFYESRTPAGLSPGVSPLVHKHREVIEEGVGDRSDQEGQQELQGLSSNYDNRD